MKARPHTTRAAAPTGILMLAIAAGGLPLAATAAWDGQLATIDGIVHVANPASPMEAPVTLEPPLAWRCGGDDEEVIGFVTDCLVADDGTSYLLDGTLNNIRVHAPEGTLLRTIGRQGEGPGEFGMARNLTFLPGGYIGVLQIMPGRIVALDPQGLPGPDFNGGGGGEGMMRMIMRAAGGKDFVVLGLTSPNFSEGGIVTTYSLVARGADGNLLHTYRETQEKSRGGALRLGDSDANGFLRYWDLAADGTLYMAPDYDQYRIEVFGADGKLARIIERTYEHQRRSQEDLRRDEEENERLRQRFRADGGDVGREIRQWHRDIEALHACPDGTVWVQTGRGMYERPAGVVGTFDVLDREGRFLRQVTVKAEFDPRRDEFVLAGDRLYILKEAQARPASTATSGGGGMQMMVVSGGRAAEDDEEDDGTALPPAVLCYRLPR